MFRRAVYKKAKHCITCVYFMSPLKHWRSLTVITHNGAFWWYYSTSFFWFFIVKNSLMRVFLSSMELLMFGLGFNNSDTELYNAHTISVSLGLRNQTALQHSLTGSVLRNCSSFFFFFLWLALIQWCTLNAAKQIVCISKNCDDHINEFKICDIISFKLPVSVPKICLNLGCMSHI